MTTKNPNTSAREYALKFLYQSEIEKLFYFSESHFSTFTEYNSLIGPVKSKCRTMTEGALSILTDLDDAILATNPKWTLNRMGSIDRNVLRLATWEILKTDTPVKVIINEAIELAKTFGEANSGAFVNGILDRVAKDQNKS